MTTAALGLFFLPPKEKEVKCEETPTCENINTTVDESIDDDDANWSPNLSLVDNRYYYKTELLLPLSSLNDNNNEKYDDTTTDDDDDDEDEDYKLSGKRRRGHNKVIDSEFSPQHDHHHHHHRSHQQHQAKEKAQQQQLYLPLSNDDNEMDDYLSDMDEYLMTTPQFMTARNGLLSLNNTNNDNATTVDANGDDNTKSIVNKKPSVASGGNNSKNTKDPYHFHFDQSSQERIVYVSQAELAYASSSQPCDILLSDRATTCHIMALYSTCSISLTTQQQQQQQQSLASLTHIDRPYAYNNCIRQMFQQHIQYHSNNNKNKQQTKEEEKGCLTIDISIHIVGGFKDDRGSSKEITCWLLHLLADIAHENQNISNGSIRIQHTLETCILSSMNNYYDYQNVLYNNANGNNRYRHIGGCPTPMIRGLAIYTKTGRISFAKVTDIELLGPEIFVRQARLWSTYAMEDKLTVVHTWHNNEFRIQPFKYKYKKKKWDAKLGLGGKPRMSTLETLKTSSTSPYVEEDDFCTILRGTLQFMHDVSYKTLFGIKGNQPLVFYRRDHNQKDESSPTTSLRKASISDSTSPSWQPPNSSKPWNTWYRHE